MFDTNRSIRLDFDACHMEEYDWSLHITKKYNKPKRDYENTKVCPVSREQRIQYYSMLADQNLDLFPEIIGLIEHDKNSR